MGLFKHKVAPANGPPTDTTATHSPQVDNNTKDKNSNIAKARSRRLSRISGKDAKHEKDKDKDADSSSTASVGSAGSKAAKFEQKREKLAKRTNTSPTKKALLTMWRRFSCMFLSPVFLRHRNKIYIIFEVLVPAAVSYAIFAAFTSGISWKKAYSEKVESDGSVKPSFKEFALEKAMEKFRQKFVDDSGRALIVFTPVTNLTYDIMSHALERLNIHEKNEIDKTGQKGSGAVGVANPLELFEKLLYHRNETLKHPLNSVGISFHYDQSPNAMNMTTGLPYVMSYSIRTFDETIGDTNDDFPYMKPAREKDWLSPYVESGFLGLQFAIEYSYLRNVMDITTKITTKDLVLDDLFGLEGTKASHRLLSVEEAPVLYLRMFYYPNFFNENIRYLISFTVCCCLVTSYLFTSFFIVRQIVQENKSGIKDLLRMHGMPVYLHWVILFFHALIFRAITSLLITVILFSKFKDGQILSQSSASLIFVIIWAHLMALTFFNYFLATMIHSVGLVGLFSTLIGLLSFIVPVTFNRLELIKVFSNIVLVTVFPNWALYNVFSNIVDFECDDKGVTWKNFYKLSHGGGKLLKISTTLLLMCGSAIVYLFLAVYRDLTSQVKLFPPSFRWWDIWGRSKQKLVNKSHHKELLRDIQEGGGQDFDKPAVYEEPEPGKKCFVRIRHLCKRYGKHKLALDTLNLNIMHEEITVVLGHGGCGKSTLISVLAGMVCPTTGYATIKDHDVSFEARKARHFTGLCTQKLIHFNLLTVKQHVFLCYRLRGYDKEECNRHSATLLTRLRLWNVRNFFPDSLTNDELRRLGISMAMADAPKVLLLDEPTGGMDAFGRREIWTILKTLRQHHTIILTSNYMDEAEYLADRIALLAHGRLVCFGSVDFLKSQYDTGYFLTIEPLLNLVKLDAVAILNVVKARIGNHAREKRHKTREDIDNVIIELPRKRLSHFPELFDDLDKQLIKLGIKKYSIRRVCLSDIFIKICESIASEKDAPDIYVRRDSAGDLKSALTSQIPDLPEADRYQPKFHHQIRALLLKRWTYMITKNDFFIWEYLIPLILILLVVWEANIFSTPALPGKARNLTYDEYTNDIKVYYKIGDADTDINYTSLITKILGKYGSPLLKKDKVEPILMDTLDRSKDNDLSRGDARENHMTALEVRKPQSGRDRSKELIGYYASGSLHSAPIILNVINNILLRAATGYDDGDETFQIFVMNEPLPIKTESKFSEKCDLVCVVFALLLAFAYGFVSASTVSFPMRERRNGMKHLQLMTGVHPAVYWIADYLCDSISMLLMTCILGVIFTFNPVIAFKDTEVLVALGIFTALYFAWSGLAFSYFMSTWIPLRFNGFNFMIVFHVFVALLPFIWLEYAMAGKDDGLVVFFRIILMLFPGFTVTCAIHDWFEAISRRSICQAIHPSIQKMCSITEDHGHQEHSGHMATETDWYSYLMKKDYKLGQCCERICKPTNACFKEPRILDFGVESFAHPKLITDFFALFFVGILYWVLLIVAERRIFSRVAQQVVLKFLEAKNKHQGTMLHSPKDLKHERLVVKSVINEEEFPKDVALVVQDLTKSHTATMVINDMNLEVKKGECVGILGAGGSGKTSIMKMMSGAVIPTKGMCFIGKSSLMKNRKQYLSSIGYCPQENSLFDNFTGIQMLELMGRLRGVPSSLLKSHVAKWLLVMGLADAGKDRCKTYGPGMKRRICCAMALIGNCPLIFLDEATTGVDPLARERFWAVLEHLKATGHTIVFTTFHTQECMNLATKLMIIAEGNVQCLGTPQELKNRYARGYSITFRLRHDVLTPIDIVSATMGRVVEFKKSIESVFLYCDLIDEQDNLLLYFLRDTKITWGNVFRKTSQLCEEYSIIVDSYDVTEAAIEDLFILLTNKYREMDNPRRTEPGNEFDVSKEEAELKALEQAAQALHMRI